MRKTSVTITIVSNIVTTYNKKSNSISKINPFSTNLNLYIQLPLIINKTIQTIFISESDLNIITYLHLFMKYEINPI